MTHFTLLYIINHSHTRYRLCSSIVLSTYYDWEYFLFMAEQCSQGFITATLLSSINSSRYRLQSPQLCYLRNSSALLHISVLGQVRDSLRDPQQQLVLLLLQTLSCPLNHSASPLSANTQSIKTQNSGCGTHCSFDRLDLRWTRTACRVSTASWTSWPWEGAEKCTGSVGVEWP